MKKGKKLFVLEKTPFSKYNPFAKVANEIRKR